jgi:hypothetical protein
MCAKAIITISVELPWRICRVNTLVGCRFRFIDAGVKYIRHYLPDLVTYAASDVQPVASRAINLTALCIALKLQTEL